MEEKNILKIESLLIVIVMLLQILLPVFPLSTVSKAEESETGVSSVSGSGTQSDRWQIGKNNPNDVTAYVEGTKLYIYGMGEMMDFINIQTIPWKDIGLTELIIEDGVKNIGTQAFYNQEEITSVILPNSIERISDQAFNSCSGLTSITLSEGLLEIGNNVFQNCENLTNINIPKNVNNINNNAFNNCEKLKSINVSNQNNTYLSADGVLFNKNKTLLIKYPEGKTNLEYNISAETTTIGEYAFANSMKIENVILGENVETIKAYAFFNSKSLKNVTINNGVTSIENGTFNLCERLENVIIPDSVESIGMGIFMKCTNLQRVTLPNNITKIENFMFSQCENLETLNIPTSVTEIGFMAFNGCESLTRLIIPRGVNTIGNSAFQNLENKINVYYYPDCDAMLDYIGAYPDEANYIDITNVEPEITNISIKTRPTKTTYNVGESLDLGGLVIQVTYNDESTEDITEGFTSNPANGTVLNSTGRQTVVITYEGKTAQFSIIVNEAESEENVLTEESEYEEDGTYIENVLLKTSIDDFLANFNSVYTVTVSNENAEYIGTGMTVTIKKLENSVLHIVSTLEVVIMGDVTGDGIANISDIFEINKARLNTITLQGAKEKAANMNKDSGIDFLDILEVNKLRSF